MRTQEKELKKDKALSKQWTMYTTIIVKLKMNLMSSSMTFEPDALTYPQDMRL